MHAKLVLDLLSYHFHPKIKHREDTGSVHINIQVMPLPSAINLAYSQKTRSLLVPRENQPHQVLLLDPSIEKF